MIFDKTFEIAKWEKAWNLENDITKAFAEKYGKRFDELPLDDKGVILGTFKVTVEWSEEDKFK